MGSDLNCVASGSKPGQRMSLEMVPIVDHTPVTVAHNIGPSIESRETRGEAKVYAPFAPESFRNDNVKVAIWYLERQ